MSTLTSNANSNNNNLIITSPATSSSSSNNNNCNAINNNNNPGTPNQSQNQQHQSALASGVSSAKRLLPFARSMSSNGGAGVAPGGTGSTGGIPAELNVVLHGYHRKLKTNKKKYFVVYDDLPNKSARLEYFDSEKKFKQSWVKNSSVHAKRSIILRNCFNINKGHDPKKHVIALYTRDDCFSIVFDSEEELNRWLRTLWSLQRGEEGAEGEPPRPTFEHVWDVFVQRKGLGDSYGILGNYRLCITDKTLSLVRIGPPTTVNGDSRVEQVEFSLAAIRRCGASQRYFYLEVGRSTKTGAGEIWMEAQDAMIAHNMHTTIMKSAKNKDCDSLGPMRNRSSSANAASKPTQMLVRRQTHTGQKPINCSPSGEEPGSPVPHASPYAPGSESSSSATSTNTVVMVPPNPNSGQNSSKPNQNQPSSPSPSTASGGPLGGANSPSPFPSFPSPTPSYSGKSAIKKPKLAPPPEEEAVTLSSYTSLVRQPSSPGGVLLAPPPPAPPTPPAAPSLAILPPCSNGGPGATNTEFPPPAPPSDHAGEPSSTALMLPPSPSSSLSKYPRYHQPQTHQQQGHQQQQPFQPSWLTSLANGGSSGSSDSSSCCSSTASIQTAITASMRAAAVAVVGGCGGGAMLPPPTPLSSGSSLSLGVLTRRGGGSNSSGGSSSGGNNSGNPLYLSTIPLRRLRNSLRRHSISGAAIARERCDSLPSRNRTSSETSTVAGTTQQQQQQQLHLNSGGMPPPRTIPSASAFHQRPHSMVMVQNRQSHSHSPPVHSSPLSPPSTGACSTGSDGSSLSIDETDSFVDPLTPDEGNGFPKVINPLSSGCSIPEENSDEYIHNYGRINQRLFGQHRSIEEFGSHLRHSYNSLSLPISQAVRRGSPAPPGGHHSQLHHNLQQQQQHHHHHQQQQQHTPQMSGSVEGNYMDMCSPCGSSPGDPSGNGGYIPMSPVADYPRGLYTGSSSAHSRASSLAEDVPDGYVPMAPGGTVVVATTTASSASTSAAPEESYVDMEPTSIRSSSTHVPTPGIPTPSAGNGNISSAASSCSITSGTPSTDMRFSAYHLEKVEARFTPSEDDEMDRPLRTYSVGSRLEHNKRKLRVDMLSSAVESGGAGGNSRVRAFSVGSRAKVPRSELYKGSGGAPITAPLLSAGSSGSMQESASGSGSITNTSTIGGMVGSGSSSSVGKAGASGTSATSGKKSISAPVLVSSKPHGSFDPMDDLMEIDFGASYHGGEPESSTPQKGMGMEDYMEMGAVGGAATTAIDTGYMEMKPGHLAPVPLEESDYLDMKPGCYEPNLSTKSTSSPITINSPKKFNGGGGAGGSNNNNNYLEMSPRGAGPSSLSSSSQTQRKVPSDDYLNINPLMVGGGSGGGAGTGGDSGNEDKMTHDEDELLVAPSSAPEGYMEMSWNQNKSSLGAKVEPAVSDEYINMDFTRKELPESRLSSQPIAIQSGGLRVVGDLMMEPKMGGAPSNIPNYLPLNPAQQRHGSAQIGFSPRSRCDSRDSGIVTPSGSQATIFPFSPGSPIKPFVQADPDKCLIDGTSGTLLITELDEHSEESNESRVEDLSHNYAELSLQQPHTSNLKTEKSRPSSFKRTCTTTTTCTSTRTSASVVTTVKSAAVEYPDYVNCSPVTTPVTPKPTSTPMAVGDDQAGDYAIMNPAATATLRKLSSTSSQSELATPCPNNPSSSTSDVGLPPLLGKKSSTIGFRPITSSQDDALLRKTASGVSPKPAFARQFSERRPTGTDASGYELLQRSASSRPNSVNSEKIGCGTAATKCPPSAGSTRPNSANSDRLPVVISATSSSASSTSTLCESKNQSPMASTATLTDQPIVSRPPSVSSERELHYASLDLPPCGTNPPPTATRMDVDPAPSEAPTPDSLNSSPSPNSGCTSQQPQPQQGAFTYAQIDFDRTGAPIPPKAATGGQP
ncbi:insulin receptor substrate 1 isoform X3 [Culex pipiens pallens]|uniref:insulin receptor substrate 1 isoform X3 n=1 Tax=Culex pipiens pallens TaxID=42434 RepID=UPI0022AB3687|nr:insulin receptor substrate 1 isoform X3 [Culex pipiens pallens]